MIKHKRQILQTIEHQKKTLLLESDIDNRIDIKRNIEHERTKLKKTLLLMVRPVGRSVAENVRGVPSGLFEVRESETLPPSALD